MRDLHRPSHALRIPVLSALVYWKEPTPSLAQRQTQGMSSLFIQKHLVPQLGHSGQNPAWCCGTCISRQIYVAPGLDVLS